MFYAENMYSRLVDQMAKVDVVTEQLKANNIME